ncbi:hypothetical protein H4R24_001462 [Coemansia sp. RSA 988]|nr:hypothetical protein H4R24_001462 [Coemansia sp. RSA 988]
MLSNNIKGYLAAVFVGYTLQSGVLGAAENPTVGGVCNLGPQVVLGCLSEDILLICNGNRWATFSKCPTDTTCKKDSCVGSDDGVVFPIYPSSDGANKDSPTAGTNINTSMPDTDINASVIDTNINTSVTDTDNATSDNLSGEDGDEDDGDLSESDKPTSTASTHDSRVQNVYVLLVSVFAVVAAFY